MLWAGSRANPNAGTPSPVRFAQTISTTHQGASSIGGTRPSYLPSRVDPISRSLAAIRMSCLRGNCRLVSSTKGPGSSHSGTKWPNASYRESPYHGRYLPLIIGRKQGDNGGTATNPPHQYDPSEWSMALIWVPISYGYLWKVQNKTDR